MDIKELKARIDLHDLAHKLGLERPHARGNYRSPHRDDKRPSLSIFTGSDGTPKWKDQASGEHGDCFNLVMYVQGHNDIAEAIKYLHELYGFPMDRPDREPGYKPPERTLVDHIADNALKDPQQAVEYLSEMRKISPETVKRAIDKRAVGFSTYVNKKRSPGEFGYCGPAVVFVCRDLATSFVKSVEMRYLDPALNGNVKSTTQGEKANAPWFMDAQKVRSAKTVYLVEAPINALSIEDCGLPYTAAVAVRGVSNVDSIDWQFLQGKKVVICMDNDPVDTHQNKRPGLAAAWKIYDALTALGIAAQMVDQSNWTELGYSDPNDVLQAVGAVDLAKVLKNIDPWIIPGQPPYERDKEDSHGRSRVFLPSHDSHEYWKFRAKDDFVTYVAESKDNEEGVAQPIKFMDVCGFRIAGLSRVQVAGATSTMTGDPDTQPKTLFCVSAQSPRHGNKLQRHVFDDEKLYNPGQWIKFGPIFSQPKFQRMINILERGADNGARNGINFVGLGWRDGKPIVNEGPDCFFQDPDKQCPYHNLTFPTGTKDQARTVLGWYHKTFGHNAALQLLVWALGGHLKAFLGFWPHLVLQADKGSGKSVLTARLSRTIAMTMFSGQNLQTEFRLLTSTSGTSHPVGWEELSARRQDIIDKAVSMLQEAYSYSVTRRGADVTEYLISAPVLMAGEDVPVRSLTGKVVAVQLSKKGPMMPDDLPRFPVRDWLQFLAGKTRSEVRERYAEALEFCQEISLSAGSADEGAKRMVHNYAATLTSWRLLTEYADLDGSQFMFENDLLRQMKHHIAETSEDREPWIWILEKLMSEIARGEFRHPYVFDNVEGHLALCVRTSHVMDHMSSSPGLREFWNGLTIKSDRVFKRQLVNANVIVPDKHGAPSTCERTINGKRYSHMTPLDVNELETLGMSVPVDIVKEPYQPGMAFKQASGDR